MVTSRIPPPARTKDERNPVADQIAERITFTEHAILSPTTEYRDTRVQDFTDAEREWRAQRVG